ncbi:response regulator transcription factor [Nocardioides maradonensis]
MKSVAERTRIALVDDHVLFAESLAAVLRLEGYTAHRVPVERCHHSMAQLMTEVMRLRPTVVMVDLDLTPFCSGLDLIRPLAARGVTVVVVTSAVERARWGECLEHGARKVISKCAPVSDIVATVSRIDNGLPTMAPGERIDLLAHWHDQMAAEKDMRARLDLLTHREAEVLGMLMSGMQVGEIARQRFVSESTVRTQVKAVLAKLQVGSQLTAVGMAHQARWKPPVAEQAAPAATAFDDAFVTNHQR